MLEAILIFLVLLFLSLMFLYPMLNQRVKSKIIANENVAITTSRIS